MHTVPKIVPAIYIITLINKEISFYFELGSAL